MKKSFKFILLTMLLCVGFVFTGCGSQLDSQVKVNIGDQADYVDCTEEDNIMVAMENLEVPEESEEPITQTIKFTVSASLEVMAGLLDPESENPTEKVEVNFLANAMVSMYVEEEEEKIGAAAKVNVTMGDEKQVYELYYKDGLLYTNDGKEKLKIDASEMMGGEISMPEFDISAITEPFMEAMQNIEQQKVLKNGSKSIYQLEITEEEYLYIVFNNNKFTQAYVEIEDYDVVDLISAIVPDLASSIPSIAVDLEVALELTESAIQYPSLDKYETPSNEEVAQ